MKKRLYPIIILASIMLLLACKKEKMMLFEGENGIYMYASNMSPRILQNQIKDNTMQVQVANFAFKGEQRLRDTISFPLRIFGKGAIEARPVAVRVLADSTTAIEGQDYVLLPTAIAPNRFDGQIQVILLRNPSLKEGDKQVTIELQTNSYFPRYMYLDSANVYKQAKIIFTDVFRKPSNWDGIYFGNTYYQGLGLGGQFGAYSETKFRLIIDVFGSAEILSYWESWGYGENDEKPSGYFSEDQWRNLILVLQQRLLDYRQQHGSPLRDENGREVTIPNFNPWAS